MQDYTEFAKKNGVILEDEGPCQFCEAKFSRGIHECINVFNVGFESIDFNTSENHIFRFLIVDAHALQHPEIHGRWSNHFHLTRLLLIFEHSIKWSYNLSPKLSDVLNQYKNQHPNEILAPPSIGDRGRITSFDIQASINDPKTCKELIFKWAKEVYESWSNHHSIVQKIGTRFLEES